MSPDRTAFVTRYHDWSRRSAIGLILVTLLAVAAGIWGGRVPREERKINPHSPSDAAVLCMIIERVHAGDNYYVAAGEELRSFGYGVRSVFNWRPPLYAWFLGGLPSLTWGRAILGSLATIALVCTIMPIVRDESYWLALLTVWFVTTACFECFKSEGVGSTESWAGVLILLSVFAYSDHRWPVGFVLGLIALFFRELAAPYVIICIALAMIAKRWREITAWACGLALFAIYFAIHVVRVHQHIRPHDLGYSSGWVQFGGFHFIDDTVSQMAFLFFGPLWLAGIILPLALVGLLGKRDEFGTRATLTIVLYIAMFAVVGKSFNAYWGQMDAPLLAFGLPWLIPSARDLWRVIHRPAAPATI
ncbi:MAG: hypothetical protein JO353_02235 [Phycisphaerae bacterium]|nr:hypothetical protein [Phycisphaerae bacterium]